MEKRDHLREVRNAVLSLGFERRVLPAIPKNDAFFVRTNGGTAFQTVVSLRLMPSYQAYDVAFGVLNEHLREQIILIVTKHLSRDLLTWHRARILEFPCWNVFNIGRDLDWPLCGLPNPDDRSDCNSQLDCVNRDYLEKIALPVVSYEGHADFLLRNTCPYEWSCSADPLLRSIEVTLSLTLAGSGLTEVLAKLRPFADLIVQSLRPGESLEGLVGSIVNSIRH